MSSQHRLLLIKQNPQPPAGSEMIQTAGLSLQGSTTAPFVGDSAAAEVMDHGLGGQPPNIHTQRRCPREACQ